MAPMHEQEVDKDGFYAPGYPQLTPFATPNKERHGKNKKTARPRLETWSPEWTAFYSNPRDQRRECRYCRESSRDHQGNITHTIVKCGKLWLNTYLAKSNGAMPPRYKTPKFVTDYLATGQGRKWFRNYTRQRTHIHEAPTTPDSLAARKAFLDLCDQHTKPTTSPSSVPLYEGNELTQDFVVVQATAVKDLSKKPRISTPTPAFLKWMSTDVNLQNDVDRLHRAIQRTHGPRYLTALGGASTATDDRQEIFATTTALQATDSRSYRDVIVD